MTLPEGESQMSHEAIADVAENIIDNCDRNPEKLNTALEEISAYSQGKIDGTRNTNYPGWSDNDMSKLERMIHVFIESLETNESGSTLKVIQEGVAQSTTQVREKTEKIDETTLKNMVFNNVEAAFDFLKSVKALSTDARLSKHESEFGLFSDKNLLLAVKKEGKLYLTEKGIKYILFLKTIK